MGGGLGEPLGAELAHRVEQLVAAGGVAVLHDRLLDQADQGLGGAGAADPLGRRQPEPGREDRELGPEPLLGRGAQVVAPGDGGAQRAVPAGGGPGGPEDAEPVGQPGEDLVGGHAAQPDRRELERERYAVEPSAELGHGQGVGRAQRELGDGRLRPVDEQRDRVRLGGPVPGRPRPARRGQLERADQQRVLGRHAQRLAAGGEDAQPGRGRQQRAGKAAAALDQLLAGVEHQQQLTLGQVRGQRLERIADRLVGQPERGRDGGGQQLVVAQRGQLDQPAAVGEGVPDLPRHPQREPGLAHPARPAQGHQPMLVDGGDDGRHVPSSADEPGHLGRQIVPLLAHRQRGHDAPRVVRPSLLSTSSMEASRPPSPWPRLPSVIGRLPGHRTTQSKRLGVPTVK